MSKPTTVSLFWGSLIAFVVATGLSVVAGGMLYLNGSLVLNGPDVVALSWDALGRSVFAVAVFAVLIVMASAVAQLVAWIGAVLNTVQLQDKAWFVLLVARVPGVAAGVQARQPADVVPEPGRHGWTARTVLGLPPRPPRSCRRRRSRCLWRRPLGESRPDACCWSPQLVRRRVVRRVQAAVPDSVEVLALAAFGPRASFR